MRSVPSSNIIDNFHTDCGLPLHGGDGGGGGAGRGGGGGGGGGVLGAKMSKTK